MEDITPLTMGFFDKNWQNEKAIIIYKDLLYVAKNNEFFDISLINPPRFLKRATIVEEINVIIDALKVLKLL